MPKSVYYRQAVECSFDEPHLYLDGLAEGSDETRALTLQKTGVAL
jgi:hypothetical protein